MRRYSVSKASSVSQTLSSYAYLSPGYRAGVAADLGENVEEELLAESEETVVEASTVEARRIYLKAFLKKEMVHEPGVKYGPYSNGGYAIMGHMCETVGRHLS